MNVKAYLAAIAGAVFSFLGGWVIFGMLLMDFYMANTTSYDGLMKSPMPDLIFIFLSGLSASFLLTIIFTKWANVSTFQGGFTNGAIIYFFVVASFNLSMYGFYNLFNITLVFVDTIAQTVFGGLIGGIIGFILGTGKK
jgi:hypothetical protein